MNPLTDPQALPPANPEALPLARELADTFAGMVVSYQEGFQHSAPEGLAKAQQPCGPRYEADVRHGPPDQASWEGLEYLARQDPQQAAQR